MQTLGSMDMDPSRAMYKGPRAAQVVRCIVAGGLVRGSDAMATAPVGVQGKLRAQAAALRPVRCGRQVMMFTKSIAKQKGIKLSKPNRHQA